MGSVSWADKVIITRKQQSTDDIVSNVAAPEKGLVLKVVVIGNTAISLVNHFGPLLAAFVSAGYEVIACAPDKDEEAIAPLRDIGVSYRSVDLDRTGINPLKDLRFLIDLTRFLRDVRPEVVLNYTIKPVIFGSLAARRARVPSRFAMITGLGWAFGEHTFKQRAINALVRQLYQWSLPENKAVFFQNPDDLTLFINSGLVSDPRRAVLTNGLGVDLNYFAEVPPYTRRPVFLLIARLLRDKGIVEYVEAARTLKGRYPHAEFHLMGPLDSNPACIDKTQIEDWQQEGIIEYLGEVKDVRPFIANSSVFVLPSYREGTSRATLEAMAMGRPIVTTDVPGCRQTVVDGENGFLVTPNDTVTLTKAMERFILRPDLVVSMGKLSRKIAVEKYDVQEVNAVIMKTMGLLSDEVSTVIRL
jgi:glycosyltransferase involved in cell wall biosynthesis